MPFQPPCRFPVSTQWFILCITSGEIVVNEVNFVRKCIAAEKSLDDLWGKLICTNFKVSFVTHEALAKPVGLLCTASFTVYVCTFILLQIAFSCNRHYEVFFVA